MDCRTARQLLTFARPHAAELEATEAAALERHLARCPACDSLARTEGRLDEHLGRAMRQVDVPDRLRGRLLARLEAERGDWYRRWFGHGLRALAGAAAVLLLVWGWWYWRATRPPQLDVAYVFDQVNFAQPGEEDIEHALQVAGIRAPAPPAAEYNYALLTAYGQRELPGYPGVPVLQMVFLHKGQRAQARLYILSARQFDLSALPGEFPSDPAYRYKLEIRPRDARTRWAYLIFYTGSGLDWLNPEAPAT